jgi:altronate hydrolase
VSDAGHAGVPRGSPRLLVLDGADNVAVALAPLAAGDRVAAGGATIEALDDVPVGHKVALAAIAAGAVVVKYGETIGVATEAIEPGRRVHVHNLVSARLPGDVA